MNLFLDKINSLYNYDQKIVNALSKIIPNMIKYYGKEYENVIYSAIVSCEIILCNSYETVLSVIKENSLSYFVNYDKLVENDNKFNSGLYFSSPLIVYDKFSNKFRIDGVNRKIIISHTYNLDSPKGIEILTYSLCSLVKSYNNEYKIDNNYVYIRNGFYNEKRKIIYDGSICYLEYVSSFGVGINNGLNVYDTDKIVSLVLNDDYKCYEYNSLCKIVFVLYEKLGLKSKIVRSLILDKLDFAFLYNINLYNRLCLLCDECMSLEQNMVIYDVTREDKNKTLSLIVSKLNNDVYLNFEEYLDNRRLV